MSDSHDSTASLDIGPEHGHVSHVPAHAESHGAAAEVAGSVSDALGDSHKHDHEDHAPNQVKKIKKPSKTMVALKKGVHNMVTPITHPVKSVMNQVRGKTLGLLDRLKAGEHLSKKEILAILVVIPGASLLLGAHYANLFSKKAQAAIEAGKVKWEKFLHSLGLSKDASVHDIHHAEEHATHSASHASEHPTMIDPVGEVGHVGAEHAPVANDDHVGTGHMDTHEYPGQKKAA